MCQDIMGLDDLDLLELAACHKLRAFILLHF